MSNLGPHTAVSQSPLAQNSIAQNSIAQNSIAQNPMAQNPMAQNPMAQSQNTQDPLQNLRDIHLPEAINDFPIAWGWWVLLILIITGIGTSLFLYLKHRKKNAIKRSALALLKDHYEQYKDTQDSQHFLQNSNQVLKRYCLTHYPQAVGLSGSKWTQFLVCYSQKTSFSNELILAISEGQYQKKCHYNADDLYHAFSSWLNTNKPFVIDLEQGDLND